MTWHRSSFSMGSIAMTCRPLLAFLTVVTCGVLIVVAS
jgi:hypothetical protein